MISKDTTYIHFPLHFLQRTFPDPLAGLDFILRFGVCNYAAKIKTDLQTVAMQTLYVSQRGEAEKMPPALADFVREVVPPDEDFKGFDPNSNGHFKPHGVPELADALQQHPDRQREAVRMYQLRQVAGPDQFNIDLRDYYAPWQAYDEGMDSVEAFTARYGPDVWPSCKLDLLFDVIRQPGDIDLWRGYVAIKSIIGRKKYASTCKPIIRQRMNGAKNKAVLEAALTDPATEAAYDRYGRRRQMDGLLQRLVYRRLITKLPHGRQLYVASSQVSLNNLVALVANDLNQRNQQKQERDAKQKLNELIKNSL